MRILFQGDSITDAGRRHDPAFPLGYGYAKLASETLIERFPDEKFEFINRGISAYRTENLLEHWDEDAVSLKPDIISIMIGINDTWHFYDNLCGRVEPEDFERRYRELLLRLKKSTSAKIIILEQFLLYAPDKEYFREDLDPKIQITRRLAREFADALIPLDGLFAAASVGREAGYFSQDGVHPNEAGAKFIAEKYVEAAIPLIEGYL